MGAAEKSMKQQDKRETEVLGSPGCQSSQSCAPLKFQSVSSNNGTCPSTQSTTTEKHKRDKTTMLVAY